MKLASSCQGGALNIAHPCWAHQRHILMLLVYVYCLTCGHGEKSISDAFLFCELRTIAILFLLFVAHNEHIISVKPFF